ncbi:MAG: HigA family addiction module antitoxin [Flavobacterium sp.]|uniref:HigA family addiction module antitoxin n=1 Tax=Flavobacterium sp. TaxID=239 RepID=UPI0025C32570|nr:HigA family addiction module antitoxin [Flavobacterium sp.]MCK6609318.1 HigA family addiction module antitoxin [Flavobacterium sp.]
MKNKIRNIHPGEILDEEFLKPMELSAYKVSKITGIPQSRLSEIISGKRSISATNALKLGKFFNLPPQFWLTLQNDYDLLEESRKIETTLSKIHVYTEFVKDINKQKKMPSVASFSRAT